MNKFNFELFENFKDAVMRSGLELHKNSSYYSVKIPNTGRYIYCWTPLNKIQSVYDLIEREKYDMALDCFRDNIDDFHLEIDSYTPDEFVSLGFIREQHDRNLTSDQILDIIEMLKDDKIVAQKILMGELIYSDES